MEDIRSFNVGSSDYSKHKIQPWDIWLEYQLNPFDADIVKRVLRKKAESGMTLAESRILDYQKIIHIANERIRQIKANVDAWNELSNQETFPCKATVITPKSEHLPRKTNKPYKFMEARRSFEESLETLVYFDSYAEMMEYISNHKRVQDFKNYYGEDIDIHMSSYGFDARHGWDDKVFEISAYCNSRVIGGIGFCNNTNVPLDKIASHRDNNRNVTQ